MKQMISHGILACTILAATWCVPVRAQQARPNILFILADDMGYGDLSCYGQQQFRTPHIDSLAAEGMRFTNCYSGSTICAPSRSVLLTGQHTGHTRVRGNMCTVGGTLGYKGTRQVRRMALTDEDVTIGNVMQRAGYHTGIIGKWHVGAYDPKAGPMDRGFDEFSGWLINEPNTAGYYPTRRVINRTVVDVPVGPDGKRPYSTDMCTDEAIAFLKKNGGGDHPFFLYLAYNNPHSPLVVPDMDAFAHKDWPDPVKIYAAKIHRLDQNIERLVKSLKEQGLDDKTVVFFCSDNGPRSEPQQVQTEIAEFFDSNGPLRGYKRDLYEGGIRIPMIVRAPGLVAAQTTRDVPWTFADVMATIADLGGAWVPVNTDSTSVTPVLLGQKEDVGLRFLYWEYYEGGFKRAIRWGQWKAVCLQRDGDWELYDLSRDLGEQQDVAPDHPEILEQIKAYAQVAHVESENWPLSTIH